MVYRFVAVSSLLLFSLSVGLAQSPDKRPRTVAVRGTGTISAKPDQVRLSMQVMARAEAASSAMTQASDRTRTLLKILQDQGVDVKDIQTTRISVFPEYDREKRTNPPAIVGYAAQNDLTALFRGDAISSLGTFLDQAVAAGATNFGGMNYETSERSMLEQKALELAATDARARAERLASQLGVSVGPVVSISETGLPRPGSRGDVMTMGEAAAPVMTGEMEITVRVDVVFELVSE